MAMNRTQKFGGRGKNPVAEKCEKYNNCFRKALYYTELVTVCRYFSCGAGMAEGGAEE
jgi:hypothetical protein